MTNREEFRDLLYGTFYESISDSAIIRQQHEKIRTWVQSNIPSRLYRYRAVNDHTFDALRKDEIWFAERDNEHSTRLYSLSEFKTRNDKSVLNDYIQGRYGAIPCISEIESEEA